MMRNGVAPQYSRRKQIVAERKPSFSPFFDLDEKSRFSFGHNLDGFLQNLSSGNFNGGVNFP